MGVPDDQMNFIVPISIKLKHYDESDKLNQLVNQMSDMDEEQYGLSDYFPLDIKISQGNDMTAAHIDFQGKSRLLDEDTLFLHSMEETLSYNNIEKMTFSTDGKQGAMFAHAGYLKEVDIPHQKIAHTFFTKGMSPPQGSLFQAIWVIRTLRRRCKLEKGRRTSRVFHLQSRMT